MSSLPESKTFSQLFGHYRALDGVYDELMSESGSAWQSFLRSLDRLGFEELSRRWRQAQRLIHEHGIGYSPYGDPHGRHRPWSLDGLPLVLHESKWNNLSAGLKQRAILLDRVLRDVYGPQRLIRDGDLPPEVIYEHPGFYRAYHGQPADGGFLHLYAADLARAPNGNWWVLNDRSEAPSGVGFALENRIVISRMIPDIFRQCNVERLAPYFVALQDRLTSLCPKKKDDPRIVILTQGPESKNYFEDAYLSRYLGYTMVRSADLALRNNHVMLKTIDGLQTIDVILRRPNSDDCDPLELNGRSGTGLAGLLQAHRLGNVGIANALGTGLVESPIFMAFLPSLAKRLLGEDLLLPGIATWWCGIDKSRDYVLNHLDQLTIKYAYRSRGTIQAEEQLNELPRDQLVERLKATPRAFVAQERIDRSTAPVWSGDKTEAAHVALRSYLVAQDDSYFVMQGGLTRTANRLPTLEASLLAGEGSKDTWILSDSPVQQITLLKPLGEAVKLRRSGNNLPSRVCDNIYWLGRHIERSDAAARLLRTVAFRLSGERIPSSLSELPALLRTLADQGQIEPGFAVEGIKERLPAIEQTLPLSIFDKQQVGCLRRVMDETLRIAANVRDRMSLDSWRVLVRMDQSLTPTSKDLTDLINMLNEVIYGLSAFAGMVTDSMTRTPAFRFLNIGRRLEQSLQIISLLKNCFVGNRKIKGELLEAVLDICDSLMTYRSRYLARLQLAPVLDLLMTDESNPRSLSFQLAQLAVNVDRLPRHQSQTHYALDQRLAMSILHTVRMLDIEQLCELHSLGDHSRLEKVLTELEVMLPQLSNAISHRYLVHAETTRQLTELRPPDGH